MIADVNLRNGSGPVQAGSGSGQTHTRAATGEKAGRFAAVMEQAEAASEAPPRAAKRHVAVKAAAPIVPDDVEATPPEWTGPSSPLHAPAVGETDVQIEPDVDDQTQPAADGVLHVDWLPEEPPPLLLRVISEPAPAAAELPAGDQPAVVNAPAVPDGRNADRHDAGATTPTFAAPAAAAAPTGRPVSAVTIPVAGAATVPAGPVPAATGPIAAASATTVPEPTPTGRLVPEMAATDSPAIAAPAAERGTTERPAIDGDQVAKLPGVRAAAPPVAAAPPADAPPPGATPLPLPESAAAAAAPAPVQKARFSAAASRLSAALERAGTPSADAAPAPTASGTSDPASNQGTAFGFSAPPRDDGGATAAVPARAGTPATTFTVQAPQAASFVAPAAPAAAVTASPASDLPGEVNVQQLVQTMRMQFRDGIGEAVVRLRPEHLGEVSITLRVDRLGVSAVVHAEVPSVRQWLESQEGSLRQGLADQGLHLQKFVVREDGAREPEARQEPPAKRQRDRRPEGEDDLEPRFEVTV